MDAVDYFHSSVTEQADAFDVYRSGGGNSYTDSESKVGVAYIAISDVSAQFEVVTEGSDESVSYIGRYVPSDSTHSNSTVDVYPNDELRRQNGEQRYVVQTKAGRPNDITPEMWALGLDRANTS